MNGVELFVGEGSRALFDPEFRQQILLEIVGCMGLAQSPTRLMGSRKKSSKQQPPKKKKPPKQIDPICIVKLAHMEVHRTGKQELTNGDPIWTILNGSLCLLEIPKDEAADATIHGSPRFALSKSKTRPALETGVTIEIVNTRGSSGHKKLGFVSLTLDQIRDIVEESPAKRLELPVLPSRGSPLALKDTRAVLALRMRPATVDDLIFLGKHPPLPPPVKSPEDVAKQEAEDPLGTRDWPQKAGDMEFKEVRAKSFFMAYKRTDRATGEAQYRVMPRPDPTRPKEETEWMSKQQILTEAMKPSHHFVHAGTGTVGNLYVEVIGCNDLPNMDVNVNADDKTDPFVAMVLEDCMVRTDMLWDELNPRWMPWTMRAFCFHLRHPQSLLLLGVFDYDETPLENHDAAGRIVVNVANFYPNTTYVLHYPLQHDPRNEPHQAGRGQITLRLRVEWHDEVEMHKLCFTTPPKCIINCKTDKTYQVLRYLKRGPLDMERSSMDSIKVYWAEVGLFWVRYCHFLDILFEVFLWRGRLQLWTPTAAATATTEAPTENGIHRLQQEEQEDTTAAAEDDLDFRRLVQTDSKDESVSSSFYDFMDKSESGDSDDDSDASHNNKQKKNHIGLIHNGSIWFPHHSIILSASVLLSLEYPRLIGPIFLYSIAYVLLTINWHNSRHPYPWKQSKQWMETNVAIFHGKPVHKTVHIEPDAAAVLQGQQRDAVANWRGKRMSALIGETLQFYNKIYAIYSTTSVTSKFFSTDQHSWSLLGDKLTYPHMALKYLCKYTRLYLAFINWDGYAANNLVLQCLILATIWLFLPVNSILLWVLRILAWTLLGPWMKLVDIYWVHKWYKTSDELNEWVQQHGIEAEPEPDVPDYESILTSGWLADMSYNGRLITEHAIKLKDMRDYRFGHYSEFIPFMDDSRYPSVPLPQSTAHPYVADEAEEDEEAATETHGTSTTSIPASSAAEPEQQQSSTAIVTTDGAKRSKKEKQLHRPELVAVMAAAKFVASQKLRGNMTMEHVRHSYSNLAALDGFTDDEDEDAGGSKSNGNKSPTANGTADADAPLTPTRSPSRSSLVRSKSERSAEPRTPSPQRPSRARSVERMTSSPRSPLGMPRTPSPGRGRSPSPHRQRAPAPETPTKNVAWGATASPRNRGLLLQQPSLTFSQHINVDE